MDTREWMRKYLGEDKAQGGNSLIGIMLLCGGIFMFVMAMGSGEMGIVLIALGGVVIGGYMISSTLGNKSGMNNWINMMEREGKLYTALTDFREARDFLGGELRLGQYWCFGKGAKVPTAYGEIVRVYQQVHKTNLIEDGRMLLAVTTTGATKFLCKLPVGGRGDEELNRALNYMLNQNPNIRIGYQN